MGKYLIVIAVLLCVGLAVFGFVYMSRPATPAPSEPQRGINQINSTVSVSANPEAPAVQAAFQNELRKQPESDNTTLGATRVVGEYALQSWAGNIMGGEALLKYDRSQGQWILVDAGGGSWSVGVLVGIGVPQDVAEALLAN